MNNELIFWPVLAQVLLTLLVFVILGARKARDIRDGKADRSRTALDNKAWSDEVIKASNNIANQFQTPVIFYVVCLIIFSVGATDKIVLSLCWIFVISRYAHAWIHIGSNFVPYRMRAFIVGYVALMLLTLYCALGLATG